MRTIMVLNAKGGSGKSTIATNLASYYAYVEEKNVVLVDFDPQASSLAWLEERGEEWPEIKGIAGFKDTVRIPKTVDRQRCTTHWVDPNLGGLAVIADPEAEVRVRC